jgi:hypothetical protein
MKPLRQESFGVFLFSSKTMHDRTCSQGFFFWNSKVSTKIEIMLVFVQNKRVLEIQVIP